MFSGKTAAIISFSSLLFASASYAALNTNLGTPSKPGLSVTMQNSTNQGSASSAGTLADKKITNGSIHAAVTDMIEKNYNMHNINVKVFQGTVVLRGYAENNQIKQNIERDVRKIPGVKIVNNMLEIK